MLALFLGFGAVATAALYFVGRGQWVLGAALFVIGNIGVRPRIVFYESLLPHIARQDEVDRVSMAGYAAGYLGGGLLLIATLVAIQKPDIVQIPDAATAMRLSFVAHRRLVGGVLDPAFPHRPRAAAGAATALIEAARSLLAVVLRSAWATRCVSCAATGRRSCSCWPSCSTTTA